MPMQIVSTNSIGAGVRLALGATNSGFILPGVTIGSTDGFGISASGSNENLTIEGNVFGTLGVVWTSGMNNEIIVGEDAVVQGYLGSGLTTNKAPRPRGSRLRGTGLRSGRSGWRYGASL